MLPQRTARCCGCLKPANYSATFDGGAASSCALAGLKIDRCAGAGCGDATVKELGWTRDAFERILGELRGGVDVSLIGFKRNFQIFLTHFISRMDAYPSLVRKMLWRMILLALYMTVRK